MPHRRKLLAERLEPRHLLTITVDTLVDELDGSIEDGDVSLRDAIAAAADGEVIDFSVRGTIDLTLGALSITRPLSIQGPGRDELSIDAGQKSRVFNIDGGDRNHVEVSIAGLTITGGLPTLPRAYDNLSAEDAYGPNATSIGGDVEATGVLFTVSGGDLSLSAVLAPIQCISGQNRVTMWVHEDDNGAPGNTIESVSRRSVSSSHLVRYSFSGQNVLSDGASYWIVIERESDGQMSWFINDQGDMGTVVNRTAGGPWVTASGPKPALRVLGLANGGGIRNTEDLTLADVTVSGNSTLEGAAGFDGADSGDGGGIWSSGTLRLSSSHVTGNSTGKGGDGLGHSEAGGRLFTGNGGDGGNGGGIFASGLLTISDSVIAENTSGDGGDSDYFKVSGEFVFPANGGHGGSGGGIYATGPLSIHESTITGNSTGSRGEGYYPSGGSGGGIFTKGDMTLVNSEVSGNTTGIDGQGNTPAGSAGGGVYVAGGTSTIIASRISGNTTGASAVSAAHAYGGDGGNGGGVAVSASGSLSLTSSIVSDNKTGRGENAVGVFGVGSGGAGGGIFSRGNLAISSSALYGNSTGQGGDGGGAVGAGTGGRGGAIFSDAILEVVSSSIFGNSTGDGGAYGGLGGDGGGIWSSGTSAIRNSTISGNVTGRGSTGGYPWSVSRGGSGGGVWASAAISIAGSTIVENRTGSGQESQEENPSAAGSGGGLVTADLTLFNSIVAKNLLGVDPAGGENAATGPDIKTLGIGMTSVLYSLLGDNTDSGLTESQFPDEDGNLIGSATGGGVIDPLLGPLDDNGGPTWTHLLLRGSPAINAGDPAAVMGLDGIPVYDQRGEPFARVSDGRMDIGAVEIAFAPSDFDSNGTVDGDDFLLWQAGFNLFDGDAATSDGDANGDGFVNGDDLLIWQLEYGARSPGFGAARPQDSADRSGPRATGRSRWQMPASHDHEEASTRAAIQDEVLAQLNQLRPKR